MSEINSNNSGVIIPRRGRVLVLTEFKVSFGCRIEFVKAYSCDEQDGCLLFMDEEGELIRAYAPGGWDRLEKAGRL